MSKLQSIAAIATIIGVIIAAIALIPSFGQWLFPRAPVPNSEQPAIRTTQTAAIKTPNLPTQSPPLTILPSPSIPLYDDFEDGILDLNKWEPPPWNGGQQFRPVQADGALRFKFGKDEMSNGEYWADWSIRQTRPIREVSALITLGKARPYGFGLSTRSLDPEHPRYDFWLSTSRRVAINDNGKELEYDIGGDLCCPYTHLLGMKADLNQAHFYVDNKLVASLPMKGDFSYAGFQILTNEFGKDDTVASVSDVWVDFSK